MGGHGVPAARVGISRYVHRRAAFDLLWMRTLLAGVTRADDLTPSKPRRLRLGEASIEPLRT